MDKQIVLSEIKNISFHTGLLLFSMIVVILFLESHSIITNASVSEKKI